MSRTKKVDIFKDRPMPPMVEVVVRHGTLDRLIKCPNMTCRGRHYESLITADDICLNCGTKYSLTIEVHNEDAHLLRVYGHTRFYS